MLKQSQEKERERGRSGEERKKERRILSPLDAVYNPGREDKFSKDGMRDGEERTRGEIRSDRRSSLTPVK